MPRVSAVLAVYNGEKYIRETIESIINQTFSDFELIIINDCSIDNTETILAKYSDSRIRIFNNKTNLGVSTSANIGIDNAVGEYIARIDADDICMPDRFKKQILYMDRNPNIGVCGSAICKFNQDGIICTVQLPTNPKQAKVYSLFNSPLAQPSVMIRKELLNKYNLRYNTKINNAEDYELWVKCLRYTDICSVPKVLLKYRVHEKQVTQQKLHIQISNASKIRKKLYKELLDEISQEQITLLDMVAQGKRTFSEKQCRTIEKIMLDMVKVNKNNKIYDQRTLKQSLAKIHSDLREQRNNKKRHIIFRGEYFVFLKKLINKIIRIIRYKTFQV